MMPYVSLLLGASLFMALASSTRPREKDFGGWTPFDLAALAVLVAFAGSRVGVGTDYELYSNLWRQIDPNNAESALARDQQEVGFVYLQVWLKQVSTDVKTLFWVTATLTVVPVFWVVKQKSRSPALAIWLYICLGSYLLPFNIVRQGMAAALLLVAATCFLDRRRVWFLVLAALAGLLHASAIPAAILLFLTRNWRPTAGRAALIIAAGTLLAGFILEVVAVQQLAVAINPRYATYLVADPTGLGTYLTIGVKAALLALCFVYAQRLDDYDRRYLLYAIVGLAVTVVGTQVQALARLDLYFSIFLILVVPHAVKATRSRALQLAVVCGALLYLAALVGNYAGLLPYDSHLL